MGGWHRIFCLPYIARKKHGTGGSLRDAKMAQANFSKLCKFSQQFSQPRTPMLQTVLGYEASTSTLSKPTSLQILSRWWFQIFFMFTLPREMIQFDEHIFQMGWNHQLVNYCLIDWLIDWPLDQFILIDWIDHLFSDQWISGSIGWLVGYLHN